MAYTQDGARPRAVFSGTFDDQIAADNPVRVMGLFVDNLDLAGVGFDKVTPAATGRPPYHPRMMAKLFLYGYVNGIASSRYLERACGHNLELIWLLDGLRPSFKTIAGFRKKNHKALSTVCHEFVTFCRQYGLYRRELAVMDDEAQASLF